jgi:hypothetical protein
MKKPQPVALQPGGIPSMCPGQTARPHAEGSRLTDDGRGRYPGAARFPGERIEHGKEP